MDLYLFLNHNHILYFESEKLTSGSKYRIDGVMVSELVLGVVDHRFEAWSIKYVFVASLL